MLFYLLSKNDLLGNLNLNRLLPMLTKRHDVRVFLSDYIAPIERDNHLAESFTRRLRDYPVETFFPELDAASGEADPPELFTFAGLARRYAVPVQPLGTDAKSAMRRLGAAAEQDRPDVMLCCRHDFIIPEAIFSRARRGAYNTHSGLLPDYRGPFCCFWAMLNRERESGCSLHHLTARIDAGDIVALGKVAIDYGAPLLHNMSAIYAAGLDAFERLVPALEEGKLAGTPQPPDEGVYYPEPTAQDRRRFVESGLRFVDDGGYACLLGRYLPAGRALPESWAALAATERTDSGRALP